MLPGLLFCACAAVPDLELSRVPPIEDPLVGVATFDPRIRVRTVYATADNFVGEVLYPVSRTFLRRSRWSG